jgi:hypothetical protein
MFAIAQIVVDLLASPAAQLRLLYQLRRDQLPVLAARQRYLTFRNS